MAAAVLAASGPALSQPVEPVPVPVVVRSGTPVIVELMAPLTSRTNKARDRFAIRLAAAVVDDGQLRLPAGLRGEGEIVHAAKPRWGGKPGELIVNARFVDCGAVRIPLGHLKWGGAGVNRTGEALAASFVLTPAVFFISGGNSEIPAGTLGVAKLTSDVTLDTSAAAQCAVTPAANSLGETNE